MKKDFPRWKKEENSLRVDAWTQRTERPLARFVLFSGFTLPDLMFKKPALTLPAAYDDEDHQSPSVPTFVKAPDSRWR